MTVGEVVKLIGIEGMAYDTALPQTWVDQTARRKGPKPWDEDKTRQSVANHERWLETANSPEVAGWCIIANRHWDCAQFDRQTKGGRK